MRREKKITYISSIADKTHINPISYHLMMGANITCSGNAIKYAWYTVGARLCATRKGSKSYPPPQTKDYLSCRLGMIGLQLQSPKFAAVLSERCNATTDKKQHNVHTEHNKGAKAPPQSSRYTRTCRVYSMSTDYLSNILWPLREWPGAVPEKPGVNTCQGRRTKHNWTNNVGFISGGCDPRK